MLRKRNVILHYGSHNSQDALKSSSVFTNVYTTATQPPASLPDLVIPQVAFADSIDTEVSGWYATSGNFNFFAKILIFKIPSASWPVDESVDLIIRVLMNSSIIGDITVTLVPTQLQLVWNGNAILTAN